MSTFSGFGSNYSAFPFKDRDECGTCNRHEISKIFNDLVCRSLYMPGHSNICISKYSKLCDEAIMHLEVFVRNVLLYAYDEVHYRDISTYLVLCELAVFNLLRYNKKFMDDVYVIFNDVFSSTVFFIKNRCLWLSCRKEYVVNSSIVPVVINFSNIEGNDVPLKNKTWLIDLLIFAPVSKKCYKIN